MIANRQYLVVSQNPGTRMVPKIAGKWMFIPLKMVLIGIDPYPFGNDNFEVRENIPPSQVSVAATTVRAQADE